MRHAGDVRDVARRGASSYATGAATLICCERRVSSSSARFLFAQRLVEQLGILLQAEDLGPGAQGSVDGDLVMLDLVAGGDQDDVADAVVGSVADLRFGGADERAVTLHLESLDLAFGRIENAFEAD